MPRVLMNFQFFNAWTAHFIAQDCRTPISRFIHFPDLESLRAFAVRGGCEAIEEFDDGAARRGRGSVWMQLTNEHHARLR